MMLIRQNRLLNKLALALTELNENNGWNLDLDTIRNVQDLWNKQKKQNNKTRM
jgi:hypothetical protein